VEAAPSLGLEPFWSETCCALGFSARSLATHMEKMTDAQSR